jgi:hypothetical protein
MTNFNSSYGIGVGSPEWIHSHGLILLLVVLWGVFWGGLALWHSGRRGNAWWFIIFLFVHTFGILEIIYLFGVLKLKFSQLFSK